MSGSVAAQTAPVAQMIIAVVPIVGIVMGSVVIFFYLLWRHRQISRQIAAGIYKRPAFDLYAFAILCGFLLSSIGLVLTLLFLLLEGLSYSLLGGLIPFALGGGRLGFYFVMRADKTRLGD